MATAPNLKKPANKDWDWKEVLLALHKRGWSLRQVGIAEGYPDGSALGETARRPYPKAEAILAAYAGVDHPKLIWPSRYDADGIPNRKFGPAPKCGQRPRKAITLIRGRNPQAAVSA